MQFVFHFLILRRTDLIFLQLAEQLCAVFGAAGDVLCCRYFLEPVGVLLEDGALLVKGIFKPVDALYLFDRTFQEAELLYG